MAAEQAIIGNDDVVADFAVMSDVRPGHEKIFVTDLGHAVFSAPSMDRAMLANYICVPDRDVGLAFGRKGKVLRRGADNCARPDHVV